MKNPYEVLGVSKTATADQIKVAYRKLAKKFHPDLNPGNKVNEEKFKEISVAYDLVGTPEQRAKFDSGELDNAQESQAKNQYYRQSQGGTGARYSQGFEMDDDFLSSIFGGGFGGSFGGSRGRRGGGQTFSMTGEDLTYKMEVDFKDAVLGAEKHLSLPGGKTLQVKIPAGIKSGQKLRFVGQGGKGTGDAPAGNLLIEVEVLSSPEFTRVGDDLESEVPIPFEKALLGGDVSVHTVEGNVMLTIPPHSNAGTKLRIKGKGIAAKDGSRGNHIVKLKVKLPDPPDPQLDALVKEWASKKDAV